MTVAVDANVLLDLISKDPTHREGSLIKMRGALSEGDVIVGEVVVAELSPALAEHQGVRAFLNEWGVTYEPSHWKSLNTAGAAFRAYLANRGPFRCPTCGTTVGVDCPRCGATITRRQHILADFMIGAHALVHAGRLLTRDRGYYRTYFPDLVLV